MTGSSMRSTKRALTLGRLTSRATAPPPGAAHVWMLAPSSASTLMRAGTSSNGPAPLIFFFLGTPWAASSPWLPRYFHRRVWALLRSRGPRCAPCHTSMERLQHWERRWGHCSPSSTRSRWTLSCSPATPRLLRTTRPTPASTTAKSPSLRVRPWRCRVAR